MLIVLAPRRCEDCVHFEIREDERQLVESWCATAVEPIHDERVAQECEDFVLDQFPPREARKPGHSLTVQKEDTHV